MSLPSTEIRPDVSAISRLIALSSVVFPLPDSPRTTSSSPFHTSSDTVSTAGGREDADAYRFVAS